jgi:hypothetical protein
MARRLLRTNLCQPLLIMDGAGACEASMADRAQTGAPRVSAAARGTLLATKLHSPNPSRLRAAQRLLQQLDEGAARELTLVCAPAGFWQTSLLADLAGRSQQAVAWLSFDQGDNDPTRSTTLPQATSFPARRREPAARSAYGCPSQACSEWC